jgi:hypothetical protein
MLCKPDPGGGQFIKMGGLNDLLPVAPHIAVTQIVGHDKNDIWGRILLSGGSTTDCKGQEQQDKKIDWDGKDSLVIHRYGGLLTKLT